MKSSIAAPCFRNSGLLTTLKGWVVSWLMISFTFAAVPTGTVLLLTTTLYPFIARATSRATPSTCCRSADPSSPVGVPTAMKMIWESRTPRSRAVVNVSRFSARFRRTISSRPGS